MLTLGFLSHINEPILQITQQFEQTILSKYPVASYARKHLNNRSFQYVTNRASNLKSITGPAYKQFVMDNKLKCEKAVSAQRLKRHTRQETLERYLRSRGVAWRYFSQQYRELKLESKELYLRRCTYFVLDPHMDVNGVRRKIRRVIPPKREYERARVSRSEGSTETTLRRMDNVAEENWELKSSGSRHYKRIQSSPSMEVITNTFDFCHVLIVRNYHNSIDSSLITHVICLNISVFDVQWGEIMIRDSSLIFTVTRKPESIQGRSYVFIIRS